MGEAPVDRLTNIAAAERIPLYAMLELTWRCNFRCVHCYQEGLRERHAELSTAEWKRVMDELAQLGCVFLTLSGGEATTRKDFPEIYSHAVQQGFVVTVFTNGSMVSESLLALWARLPPRKVEVTLYGMSPEKYREVTGHADGFAKAIDAVERLTAMGIRVELKAPAMRPLMADLAEMARFAKERGLSFRSDPGLFPRLDGDRTPLLYRLSPNEVAEIEAKTPGLTEALDSCFAGVPELGDKVYRCGAASNSVNVDPSGHFEACAISRGTSLDWRAVGAASAWEGLAPEAARTHRPAHAAAMGSPGAVDNCGACRVRGACSRCPGKSWLEAGDVEKPVAHHCEISSLLLDRGAAT